MWGDMGRCREMCLEGGDVGRCGEMCLEGGGASRVRARGARQWMESLGACREMWGHAHAQQHVHVHVVGRYGEV